MSPQQIPDGVSWSLIPDFDGQSRVMFCSTSGQPKRPGEPVARGSMIDMEGFYDICLDSAKQLARLVGYVPGDDSAILTEENERLREQYAEVVLENAELHTTIESLRNYDTRFYAPEPEPTSEPEPEPELEFEPEPEPEPEEVTGLGALLRSDEPQDETNKTQAAAWKEATKDDTDFVPTA